MATIFKEVEVEVDVELDDFDTEDLAEELERRGWKMDGDPSDAKAILESMFTASKLGNKELVEELTHRLYWVALGKTV